MEVPAWLQNKTVVVVKTANGFALAPQPAAQISECVVFETFAALTYYLDAQFNKEAPA